MQNRQVAPKAASEITSYIFLQTLISQDLHTAMMILGVNIMEQECIDMTNEVAKNGHIYFPEFCRIVLRKFREDDDEQFAQVMFKVKSAYPVFLPK